MKQQKIDLENDKDYQLKKSAMENRSIIVAIAMIMMTILGGITMIGLFWGKEGLTNFGIGVIVATGIGVLLLGLWSTANTCY